MSAAIKPRPAIPPTVPPAMAPALDFFEPEDVEVGGGAAPVVEVGASDDVVLVESDAELLDSLDEVLDCSDEDEDELDEVGSSELVELLEVVLLTEVVGFSVPVKTTWRVLSLGMLGIDVNTVAANSGLPQPTCV